MSLRKFNNILSTLVILLGLYIALSPFLPQIAYWLRDKSPEVSAPYAGALAESVGSNTTEQIPSDNRIVIPSIQINEPIVTSNTINSIKDGGTWLRPNSKAPNSDGNTVIVGHRFYGSNVSTFYHLDKVLVGQKLAVYWEGQEILYEVQEVKIVDATQVAIEAPTKEKQLTLYTCHPIWTAKQRLVIVAKPVALETESIGQETTNL
jgi:LPXTG-site transpeptidase (sortase) family protein